MLKFKLYYDKDAEEEWLKTMSSSGWAFKKFFLGFYTFVPCAPFEYSYQIALLDNWKGDKADFATFMEEVGVDVVGQWWRWVYLQKKTVDGPFELYTDLESKIAQYTKIRDFFIVFSVIELICFCMELIATISTGYYVYGIFTIILGAISLAFLRIVRKTKLKITQFKREVMQ